MTKVFPGLRPDGRIGVWQETAGPVLASSALDAQVGLFAMNGGRLEVGPNIRAIEATSGGVRLVAEDGTAFEADVAVEGENIAAIGKNLGAGKKEVDAKGHVVAPGFIDAHTHMAMTYKEQPENNYYYLTYIMDSTPLRAIQAASNGIQLLDSGFTVVRDVGNAGDYAEIADMTGV